MLPLIKASMLNFYELSIQFSTRNHMNDSAQTKIKQQENRTRQGHVLFELL